MTTVATTVDVPAAFQPLTKSLEAFNSLLGQMVPNANGLNTSFAKLGQSFSTVTGTFTESIAKVGSAISGLTSGMSKALSGDLKGAVSSALGSIGSLVSGMVGIGSAIGGVLGGILSLFQQMASFVQIANPAAFEMFTNSVQEIMAVIGQALTPVLQVVTQVIRMAGDSLASWAPQLGALIGELASGLLPIFRVFFNIFAQIGQALTLVVEAAAPVIVAFEQIYSAIYEALEPIYKTLIQVVSGAMVQAFKWLSDAVLFVTPYIIAFARVLKEIFEWVGSSIKEMLGMMGVSIPEFVKPKEGASVGAAAKGTNIGNVESLIQSAMKSAFSLGSSPGPEDPAKTTAAIASALLEKAKEIYDQVKWFTENVVEVLTGWGSKALDWLAKLFGSLAQWMIEGFLNIMSKFWKPIFDIFMKDTKGPGINGSGKSSGSSVIDKGLGLFADFGGWLDRQLTTEKPSGAV